jgi:hypothetical protein
MRATDIIRNVLDLIDQIDHTEQPAIDLAPTDTECSDDESRRFGQIIDLLTTDYQQMYNNSPAEVIAGIDSVTKDAGGGWNGPKNPADIRSDSVSMYPNYLHRPGA